LGRGRTPTLRILSVRTGAEGNGWDCSLRSGEVTTGDTCPPIAWGSCGKVDRGESGESVPLRFIWDSNPLIGLGWTDGRSLALLRAEGGAEKAGASVVGFGVAPSSAHCTVRKRADGRGGKPADGLSRTGDDIAYFRVGDVDDDFFKAPPSEGSSSIPS
jgi:hypothetical protein